MTTTLLEILRGAGELLGELEVRSLAIFEEMDVRTTLELLPEWAELVRLSDACTDGLPQTVPERRYSIFRRLVVPGGQTKEYFAEVARGLGYDVEVADVDELFAFVAEGSSAEDPDYDDSWAFVAEIHAGEITPRFARTGISVCGEPLVTSGNELLRCELDHLKPAHCLFLYVFDKPYTGYAPWNFEIPAALELRLVLPIPTVS